MKTFEERYTAWIDGRLTGPEMEAFERELEDPSAAEADKQDAHRLGGLLRAYGQAPALPNPDFFNHQLMAKIEAEQAQRAGGAGGGIRQLFSWPFVRLAAAGAFAAVLGWVLARTITPGIPSPSQPVHFAQIIETRTVDPNISATVVPAQGNDVAVLWLDGMDYLPASYELQ